MLSPMCVRSLAMIGCEVKEPYGSQQQQEQQQQQQ